MIVAKPLISAYWQSLPCGSLVTSHFTSRWVFHFPSIPVAFQRREHAGMKALSKDESEYLAYLPQGLTRKKELWRHWPGNMLSITPEVDWMCAFNWIDFSSCMNGAVFGCLHFFIWTPSGSGSCQNLASYLEFSGTVIRNNKQKWWYYPGWNQKNSSLLFKGKRVNS